MKMNRLGRSDMMVSEICLGTMTWGEQNNEADAHEQMDYALSEGVNFFDAAEMYPTQPTRAETQVRTEEYIGSWFRKSGKRDDVILATKMGGNGVEWIRDKQGFTRASVMEAVDGSLKRLGVDHIDLLQLHLAKPWLLSFPQALGVRCQNPGQDQHCGRHPRNA